jgi:hypothetical protein
MLTEPSLPAHVPAKRSATTERAGISIFNLAREGPAKTAGELDTPATV